MGNSWEYWLLFDPSLVDITTSALLVEPVVTNSDIKNPKIKTKVVHSKTKSAYNVVATSLGCKYKIARIPYMVDAGLSEEWNNKEQDEAKCHAEFISYCFNNADTICATV